MTPIRIALAILLLQAGQANRQPANAGSVEGIAVDRVTGAPIQNVVCRGDEKIWFPRCESEITSEVTTGRKACDIHRCEPLRAMVE